MPKYTITDGVTNLNKYCCREVFLVTGNVKPTFRIAFLKSYQLEVRTCFDKQCKDSEGVDEKLHNHHQYYHYRQLNNDELTTCYRI